jgi:NADP-dependent 3-hydroxy acid dehydrogenase YdfG
VADEPAGTVVAITGASRGIGAATARLLAGRGARVVLGARDAERLAAVVRAIEQDGGAVAQRVTDVRRREDLVALVELARERFGRLDVLVANAGVARVSPLEEQSVEEWDDMIDVNLRGVLHGIAATLPVFREQGHGHLVGILSTSGLKILPEQAVYAATKNAARTVLEALRQQSVPGVRVTSISPGYVATDFIEGVTDDEAALVGARQHRDAIAIPADAIARAVAYALEQPREVDVNEIVVRPTAQS